MNSSILRPHIPDSAIDTAEKHLRDVLRGAFEHTSSNAAVVVWDSDSELALALTEAYRRCLPDAKFMEFDSDQPEVILDGPFINPMGYSWDLSPDGERLLLIEGPEQDLALTELEVVTRFFDRLE